MRVIVPNINPKYSQLVGECDEVTLTDIQGAKMKRLPLVGAIASARSSNTNNQSQRIDKFELVGRLIKRPRSLAVGCGLVVTLTTLAAYAQTCAPEPPGSGLIAWWPLNETSGTAVADVLGQHPGTASAPISASGPPKSVPGLVGNGLNFFFQQKVTVPTPNGSDLDFGTTKSFTVDAWIKGQSSPILGNYNIANKLGYFLYYANNGNLSFEMGDGVSAQLTWSGPPIPANTWTFVAAVVDRTNQTVSLYTAAPNSPLATSGPLSIPSNLNASSGLPLSIGGCPGNPNGCDTVIDEVEVFDHALAATRLQEIVNAGAAGKCVAKGMTWKVGAVNPTNGTVAVGCGSTQPGACNPTAGDTPCGASLPLLCIYKPPSAFPVPQYVNNTDQYNLWSGGIVGTTAPVQASSFHGSLAQANARCEQEFGPSTGTTKWRVAEFHDGWGWNFQAYGNVGNSASRFSVHINDQPNGTCWPNP
jgi:concanavalin A-like lectin/glucanase superfamily protein